MRVVISMTAPIELPAYAAENGPYIMSMRAISDGATSPHRGPPIVLLFAMSAVSGTPSAKMRLRALELTPHTRVRHRRLRIAVVPLSEKHARQVLHGVFGVDEVHRLLDLSGGDAGDGRERHHLNRGHSRSFALGRRGRDVDAMKLDGGVGLLGFRLLRSLRHERRSGDERSENNDVEFHGEAKKSKESRPIGARVAGAVRCSSSVRYETRRRERVATRRAPEQCGERGAPVAQRPVRRSAAVLARAEGRAGRQPERRRGPEGRRHASRR